MSLTTIMNRVCPQIGVSVPAAIASGTDKTSIDLMTHCYEAGEEIISRAEWPLLYRELSVAALASSVAIPADFDRFIQGGAVTRNGTGYEPIMPVRGAEAWRFLEKVPSTQPHYFVDGSTLRFSPALTSSGGIVRYVSRNWIEGGQAAFVLDADEPDIPETLLALGIVWRFKAAKGRPYADLQEEFEAELAREIRFARGITN